MASRTPVLAYISLSTKDSIVVTSTFSATILRPSPKQFDSVEET